MGTIARFDLADLRRRFGVRHFVETGTGDGTAVAHVAVAAYDERPMFRTIVSCEVESSLVEKAKQRFAGYKRVSVYQRQSVDFLRCMCGSLSRPQYEPTLFWLDAHFPGADYGMHSYGYETDSDARLPLEREIETIASLRPDANDVIVCDDLRIYCDGPFQHGNVPAEVRPFCPKDRNIDFVHRLMDATHDVQELYEHEGYILITPKATP